MNLEGSRGRERPEKRWLNAINSDMRISGMSVDDVRDHTEWRTWMANPKLSGYRHE